MVNRIEINRNKMVVSKAGYDAANPNLIEGGKLFDSEWLYSSNVVESGIYYDPSNYRLAPPPQNLIRWDESTDWSGPNVINFTDRGYVPTVMLISLSDPRYWSYHGMVLLGAQPLIDNPSSYYRTGAITVNTNSITIPRIRSPSWYYRESFLYLIMGM